MKVFSAIVVILAVVSHQFFHQALCYTKQYSYVSESSTLDNGRERITEVKGSEYNPDISRQPYTYRKVYGMPSYNRNQVATNNIGSYSSSGYHEYSTGYGGGGGRLGIRGFYTKNAPAISTDLGGQPDMTTELSKLFHVKQGYYSELYDKMNRGGAKVPANTLPAVKGY